jgi:hypothetical protein
MYREKPGAKAAKAVDNFQLRDGLRDKITLIDRGAAIFRIGRSRCPNRRSVERLCVMSSGYPLLPQAHVMSLLILLSISAICGMVSMAVAFTNQVLYPRLKSPPVLDDSIPVHVEHRPIQKAA